MLNHPISRLAITAFLELALLPAALFTMLSLPRIYLALNGDVNPSLFDYAYYSTTAKITLILLGIIYGARFLRIRLLQIFVFIAIQTMLFIRVTELIHERNFGFKFSPVTFFHLDWTTITIAIQQEWVALLAFMFFSTLVLFAAIWHQRISDRFTGSRIPIAVILLGLTTYSVQAFQNDDPAVLKDNSPEYSFMVQAASYYASKSAYQNLEWTSSDKRVFDQLGISLTKPDVAVARRQDKPLNLIVLYLESFQANFTEAGNSKFSGLTPNLDRFARENIFIRNHYNAVMPTLNALISSQCGVLVDLTNEYIKGSMQLYEQFYCLPDVLHERGYHQIYMQGTPLGFAGTDTYVKTHHFDQALGLDHFQAENPIYKTKRHEWGLSDSDLMREMIKVIDSTSSGAPFHITAMTIDTHSPGLVDAECQDYQPENTLLNAIHCTDQAFGAFMTEIEKRGLLENTVILVIGDHMLFPAKENTNLLGTDVVSTYFGNPFFAIHSPIHKIPNSDTTVSYTPDIAPTALELLGYKTDGFFFGKSIVSSRHEFQHIVASKFQVLDGQQLIDNPAVFESGLCRDTTGLSVPVNPRGVAYTNCERNRIIMLFNQKYFGENGLIFSSRNIKK